MKRSIPFLLVLLGTASSLPAANFVTTTAQAAGQNWTALIWSNPPNTTLTAPAAGNTFQCVANGIAFGSSATGGGLNNTRVRNPAAVGVQTFPGDSLTLNADTELRAKQVGASLDFPGVGGNPGLILNGGALNAGDTTVFTISGKIRVDAPSLLIPADNGAGAIIEGRGFNFTASLSGAGRLIVCQAGLNVAQEVSSAFNAFSGGWTVKAGWLKGTAPGSLGDGDITIDPLAVVPITTASVLSNGPAQLELMYDIVSPGHLTLRNGGKMILHRSCSFAAVTIDATDLPPGLHAYAELAAAFPNNFAAGGAGSLRVGRIVTVNTANNETPGAQETSLSQALIDAQEGDVIRFAIPGPGPHTLVTPLGGYPLLSNNSLTIDGYTQPGSAPNTNPILGGNNAQIQIVLDSTGADTADNPANPARPLRRSSRLDFPDLTGNTGYGETENGILGFFGADNCVVRGLSFLGRRTAGSEDDPSIYAVALVNQATNSHVQGCWFGLAPGGSGMADLRPCASAVAAFRWRIDGDVFNENTLVGTDGDGVNDRAEFNVMVGGRISLAIEAPRLRVSGNYVNVFPDGLHFVDINANYQLWQEAFSAGGSDPTDVTIENLENGRVTDDSIIGTNGDGVGDADERNVFAAVAYEHLIEFYSSAPRCVIAGNYFGVGVDGVTASPLWTGGEPDLIELGGTASVRIGSNGDGVSDALEGNLIVNTPGTRFCASGSSAPIVARGNVMRNNNFSGVPFGIPDGSGRSYAGYYAPYVNDPSVGVPPVIQQFTNNFISGVFAEASPSYPGILIDVYRVDPAGLANTNFFPYPAVHPAELLASFTDNGPGDLNPDANAFTFNLASFGLAAGASVAVAVNYSQDIGSFNVERAVTSPLSNPVSARPTLTLARSVVPPDDTIVLHWLAPESAFLPQLNFDLSPGGWIDLLGTTYIGGRNIYTLPFEAAEDLQLFRLISQ